MGELHRRLNFIECVLLQKPIDPQRGLSFGVKHSPHKVEMLRTEMLRT